jgi:hypothetical protein
VSVNAFHSGKIISEFRGRNTLFSFKDPVKIGDIIKTTVKADLRHAGIGLNKLSRCQSKPHFIQKVDKRFTCMLLD